MDRIAMSRFALIIRLTARPGLSYLQQNFV